MQAFPAMLTSAVPSSQTETMIPKLDSSPLELVRQSVAVPSQQLATTPMRCHSQMQQTVNTHLVLVVQTRQRAIMTRQRQSLTIQNANTTMRWASVEALVQPTLMTMESAMPINRVVRTFLHAITINMQV
jgi:hypothetical protein